MNELEVLRRKLESEQSENKQCKDCTWVHEFKPRQDEIKHERTLGCRKPGWEGYTKNDEPMCGGVFFIQKESDNEG